MEVGSKTSTKEVEGIASTETYGLKLFGILPSEQTAVRPKAGLMYNGRYCASDIARPSGDVPHIDSPKYQRIGYSDIGISKTEGPQYRPQIVVPYYTTPTKTNTHF